MVTFGIQIGAPQHGAAVMEYDASGRRNSLELGRRIRSTNFPGFCLSSMEFAVTPNGPVSLQERDFRSTRSGFDSDQRGRAPMPAGLQARKPPGRVLG